MSAQDRLPRGERIQAGAGARASVLRTLAAIRERRNDWKRVLLTTGVSALLHALILIACSFILFDRERLSDILSTVAAFTDAHHEAFDQLLIQPDALIVDQVNSNVSSNIADQIATVAAPQLNLSDLDPARMLEELDAPGPPLKIGDDTAGRSQAARTLLVKKFGGTSASEAAVASGLQWLAAHQLDDGSWSFDHTQCPACGGKCSQPGMPDFRSGATGLALLAYLGGGHTHKSGEYIPQVRRGLDALVAMGKSSESGFDLRGGGGTPAMYAHGIATIALCEAYALTKDAKYATPARGAVDFIINAQDLKGGGWRYEPKQPGDLSVTGWQVMALQSAKNAGLVVPGKTFGRVDRYLDAIQSYKGARYGYQNRNQSSATMTSVGLLCRMYRGWNRKNVHLQEGIAFLDQQKPANDNMYYNYYATQVLHHWGGEEWTRWNGVLRERLVSTQHKLEDDHVSGSWDIADPHGNQGGRHYMTCLAVMTLEVYYRHLPLYQRESVKAEL